MPKNLPELNNILYSGKLSYGKWGKLFEQKIGEFIGEPKVLVVNSFNSAMLVAITAMGLQRGDEVIASPMSCLASNQPLVTQGLNIVWADIDPKRGTLNPDSVKKQITKNTKAIFHNHHVGYPGYIDEINAIGKEYGLFVVDDAIEAFGSEYKGKTMGSLGADITVFSFQTVRLPNTIDGGGLSFRDSVLFERAQLIRDLGVNRKIFRDSSGEIAKECDISLPGFGATLSELNSYIGVQQMEELKSLLKKQRENANAWDKLLSEYSLTPISSKDALPNYWVYGVLSEKKPEIIKFFREKGYYASGVHLNNNLYSVFRNNQNLKGVNDFYSKFVALPSGWWMKFDNI